MSSLDLPEVADLAGLGARDLEAALRQVDMVRRRAETLAAEIVGLVERSGGFGDDGHRSVFGWARAACNWSAGTARAALQTAHLLQASEQVRAAAADLGVDQLRLLARIYANPRVQDQFPDSAELLVGHARRLWFDELAIVAHRWENLADQDGAHRTHDRAHRFRDAHVGIVGDQVVVDAHGGVLAGTLIEEVFARFCDAEFAADWEQGVGEHGDQMCAALMQRSPAQRRFDAFEAIVLAAAESGRAGTIEPVVNLVIDQDSFEHHLNRACGVDVGPIDPATFDQRRCETIDGHQVDPATVLAAALVGHVRRVVFDSSGVVVDLGRKRRLFTGAARDAVQLADKWCLWPGCSIRSARCNIDHTRPWIHGGSTNSGNGGPMCPRHNRLKHHRFRTWRDAQG
ncbi:MAG TPA: hypothetical protein VLD86_02635, partial [Ilumatobacteraceae bacterium]|nr:hypothetical protein [Ilumatobacteraceae bacterium]